MRHHHGFELGLHAFGDDVKRTEPVEA